MSENYHGNGNETEQPYTEDSLQMHQDFIQNPLQESRQIPLQDSPMSPPSSDEEDEELEEELMYYKIAMETKAEVERIKNQTNDEFIFKKPLHPAPRAKNRKNNFKKPAKIPAKNPVLIPLIEKKVLKKHKFYYIETKYTPLPLVPNLKLNKETKNSQLKTIIADKSVHNSTTIPEEESFPELFPIIRSNKNSKTYLFDPNKMSRSETKSLNTRGTSTSIWYPPTQEQEQEHEHEHEHEHSLSGRRNPVGYQLLELETKGTNTTTISRNCIKRAELPKSRTHFRSKVTSKTKAKSNFRFDYRSHTSTDKEEQRETYYNPYIPTTDNKNSWLNSNAGKTDFELYGDPYGPGTSKAWKNWPEDEKPDSTTNDFNRPPSPPGSPPSDDEEFLSYGHFTQCLVQDCGCTFYYEAPDYSSNGGKKVFYIIESTDENVNGKMMSANELQHYMYYHRDDFISMKELEWHYEPNTLLENNTPDVEPNASDYVEAVLGPVPNGTLHETTEMVENLERDYYLFKYFDDIQSPSSSDEE